MGIRAVSRTWLFALAALVLAGLGVARLHDALIETKRQSLLAQGEIIAALLAAGASLEPERVAPLLRRLVPGPEMRARVFSPDGQLLVDTVRPLNEQPSSGSVWPHYWLMRGQISAYRDAGTIKDANYPEIDAAWAESTTAARLIVENGEAIVSVAVPVRRDGAAPAVLLLSTRAGV